jgi:sRNA-binding protein
MAIINGQIAKVGTKIGNAEVLEISKDGVRMKEFDREFTLTKDTRTSR